MTTPVTLAIFKLVGKLSTIPTPVAAIVGLVLGILILNVEIFPGVIDVGVKVLLAVAKGELMTKFAVAAVGLDRPSLDVTELAGILLV
jgi:hypothetical protein